MPITRFVTAHPLAEPTPPLIKVADIDIKTIPRMTKKPKNIVADMSLDSSILAQLLLHIANATAETIKMIHIAKSP